MKLRELIRLFISELNVFSVISESGIDAINSLKSIPLLISILLDCFLDISEIVSIDTFSIDEKTSSKDLVISL